MRDEQPFGLPRRVIERKKKSDVQPISVHVQFRYDRLQDSCDGCDRVYVGDRYTHNQLRPADDRVLLCSGGTILSDLVNSQNDFLRKSSISGLVRGEAKAKVLSGKGVNVELFSDLDASDEIEKIAGGYDSMQPPQHPRL